ncbi:hypothetical protein L1856_17255 [Streptomyces sp. Tue 6430]|nr:hypothetical protein [Streptomyces sp. Tue 6430]
MRVREGFQGAEYFTGESQARCPGKVPAWNRERGEPAPDPVAVFLRSPAARRGVDFGRHIGHQERATVRQRPPP